MIREPINVTNPGNRPPITTQINGEDWSIRLEERYSPPGTPQLISVILRCYNEEHIYSVGINGLFELQEILTIAISNYLRKVKSYNI